MTKNCGLVKRDFLLGRFVCLPLPTSKKTMIEVLSIHLDTADGSLRLHLHFFLVENRVSAFLVGLVHCSRDPQIFFSTKFLFKMGHTALFTHLKIILL